MSATLDSPSSKVLAICEYLQHNPNAGSSLSDLAQRFGMSPHYLQRKFKAEVGLSPKQYLDGIRVNAIKKQLKQGRPVTDALYEAGYSSSSRLYERSDATLGMTPAQYQKGGKDLIIRFATCPTKLGHLLLAATDRGLCCVQFDSNKGKLKQKLREEFPEAEIKPMDESYRELFDNWMASLNNYLNGNTAILALPTDVQGTAFQIKVWTYLQQIPFGEVRSYADVASAIGQPKAVRAVGTACGANKIALIIPCHRVIRGDGSLGGYRWGLNRKRQLLDQETRLKS